MKLIGQYDSPFVRRVGIALTIYGEAFEHLPYSTFGDWQQFERENPLRRVPALVLDGGEALIDSAAILDYLDEGRGDAECLIARSGPARRAALKRIALATGTAEKAVSFFYARLFASGLSTDFTTRCEAQIRAGLTALDQACAERSVAWWHGAEPGHDDIAAACVARFLAEAYPQLVNLTAYPALAAHCAKAEALEYFRKVSQPFIPPQELSG